MQDTEDIYLADSPNISSITPGRTSFDGISLKLVPRKLLFNPFFNVLNDIPRFVFSCLSKPLFLTPIYIFAGAPILSTSTITIKLHPSDILA